MTEDEVRENEYPPEAHRVVCVDFDGTLHPWVGMFDYPKPIEGGPEFVRRLKDEGYRVVIFTSRMSSWWLMSQYGNHMYNGQKAHRVYITDWCRRYDIPFDSITGEKIPAEAYIDDKAIRFTNWSDVTKQFFGGHDA